MSKKNKKIEIQSLEDYFLDQLNNKIGSIVDLMKVIDANENEIKSFMTRLNELTEENIKLLKK